ncbi:hypothetical protein CLV62_11882 [Dysgonomonas alginatilytica]|uniref:Uncharacterized protein n=1 Tax=Dysgonomonas alginatilytica TaxID=1605892 RepID=A0A2V3PTY8_9BACT|nr:hypothetical protein [Dysgonomonas alginatilytica]PXV62693.1 hypothetical protein CLV62_11882 [Dysgonomonas alginatilytica]
MRKNVIFVIVFIAVILGLVRLHTISSDNEKSQTISINGIANIQYPASVEPRNDIPFELLINPEDKALLPDSVNYEEFRPNLILLQKGFNEKNNQLLKEFPNIVANAILLENFNASILETEYATSLSDNINRLIEQNAQRTTSTISDWRTLPVTNINGATALRFEYKLENRNKKVLNIIITYLFKDDKQVELTLSAPNKDLEKWTVIYNEVLNNISIN